MKYLKLLALIFCFASFQTFAQPPSHAIGARLGGSHLHGGHTGVEFSYQMGIGEKNRLEIDAGIRHHPGDHYVGSTGTVIFHWWWNIVKGLNWFVGPGVQVGWYAHRGNHTHNGYGSYFGLGVGGQIGIEYNFLEHGAPVMVGLDARPMWDFFGHYNGFDYGPALSVRYVIE